MSNLKSAKLMRKPDKFLKTRSLHQLAYTNRISLSKIEEPSEKQIQNASRKMRIP